MNETFYDQLIDLQHAVGIDSKFSQAITDHFKPEKGKLNDGIENHSVKYLHELYSSESIKKLLRIYAPDYRHFNLKLHRWVGKYKYLE